jgi:hypothetical protein
MCDKGRKDRHSSVSRKVNSRQEVVTFDVMLPCVSMTPLASPVVPEV